MVLLILLLLFQKMFPQEILTIPKIPSGIIFDGVPDEAAWKSVPEIKMIMQSPVFMNAPTEKSEIKIGYDDQYIYFSAILHYKNPADMRPIGKKRDFDQPVCDWLGLILDSFNDRQNAVGFFTNPNGLRADANIKNDATVMPDDMNFSWNTFWDVKTRIRDSSWTAEFRIPISSLRFQSTDGKTQMGLLIFRYIPAKNEMLTYPVVSPDYANSIWKPSLSAGVVFEGLKPKKPLYLTPYVTAGFSQTSELNESGTAYKMNSTPKFDAGFDVKYSLTNNLTMDLTVNTDFAQVEADDQKINLTRYSLYFPEKRVFFQEKPDAFDFSFLEGSNLFYSRRIGIYDGSPVRIYGGTRLTGRLNKWDIGMLDMQTAAYEENPSENFGVFRAKRELFNQNSFAGGMLTTRLGMNGNYNIVYGIDGQFRVTGDDYLIAKLAQTFEKDSANKILDLNPSRLFLEWQRRNQKGFSYDFLMNYSGTAFNPGIGFETRDNFEGANVILRYGWFPGEKASIRFQSISLTSVNIWSTLTSLHQTSNAKLMWQYEAKKGYMGYIAAVFNLEDLSDTLSLGNDEIFVPQGRYTFANIMTQFTMSSSHAIGGNFLLDAGSFYDGWKISFAAQPLVNIGSSLNLGLTYNLDIVQFKSRNQSLTNHIAGIKGLLTLTTKTSLSAYIQYNTAVDKILTNIRFRYNPKEGNDFYIVYDEGLNTSLAREVPALPWSSGRNILLKYTYTFQF
jgi:hypothetical protein